MYTSLAEIGVTNRKEIQFNSKGIFSVEELCKFLPIGYRDYRKITEIRDLKEGEWASVRGEVVDKRETLKIYSVIIKDVNNNTFKINWFASYNYQKIEIGDTYVFCGKISSFGFSKKELSMNVPEAYSHFADICRILPRYSVIKGMSKDYLEAKIKMALEHNKNNSAEVDKEREEVAETLKIQGLCYALEGMHNPIDEATFKKARQRMNFDILYEFYNKMSQSNSIDIKNVMEIKTMAKMKSFVENLPFALTAGQIKALEKLKRTMQEGKRINALAMGDVGSGKTVIAVSLAVGVCENNYQVAMLAPTQVLATQNYESMKNYLEPIGFNVGLLTSNLKTKERRELLSKVADGSIDVLVGTHSVLSDNVEFLNLGLTIVDEEHRFGVAQKEVMSKKIASGVNNLSMSATPIPRSLALSIYGNSLDVLIIDTMPKGRIPIITNQIRKMDEGYALMEKELKKGRQCYVICPLIEDSDSEKMNNVDSVNTAYEETLEYFKNDAAVKIEKISGDMKGSEIGESLKRFSSNNTNILISTTIVEVGVNIPNASAIIIKSAERFGLAQLHQLRGRVGRGKYQSYCLLVSDKDKERLDVLCRTTDGFKIAEEDLNLRGAGALNGVAQTGYSNEILTVVKYPKLANSVKNEIEKRGALIPCDIAV